MNRLSSKHQPYNKRLSSYSVFVISQKSSDVAEAVFLYLYQNNTKNTFNSFFLFNKELCLQLISFLIKSQSF